LTGPVGPTAVDGQPEADCGLARRGEAQLGVPGQVAYKGRVLVHAFLLGAAVRRVFVTWPVCGGRCQNKKDRERPQWTPPHTGMSTNTLPTAPPPTGASSRRWERRWSRGLVEQARQLALGLGLGEPPQVVPYATGLSIGPDEQVWAETWARCSLDERLPNAYVVSSPGQWPVSCWAITSERLVGRLGSGRLVGWRWGALVAYQADVAHERAELHMANEPLVAFHGPGAAAIAVVAAWWLHGLVGLLEHPGLSPLKARGPK